MEQKRLNIDDLFSRLLERNYVVMLSGKHVIGPADLDAIMMAEAVASRAEAARRAIMEARNAR